MHGIENGFYNEVFAHAGIDHHVVEVACGPLLAEVALDKCSSLFVDGVHQFDGLFFRLTQRHHPLDLLLTWRINKNVERVLAMAEDPRSAASDNDGISL